MIHLEPGVDPALVRDPLSRALADFARDNGCADVVVGATDPGALRRELVRALG
jgi:nucleotide-binding universal stress UspA family protein